MKIRDGFVSNSSSSSFILPIKNTESTIKIEIPVDEIEKMISGDDGETYVNCILKTKSDVDNYMVDCYGSHFLTNPDEYEIRHRNELYEMINNGFNVIVGSVSYHNDTAENIIKLLGGSIEN